MTPLDELATLSDPIRKTLTTTTLPLDGPDDTLARQAQSAVTQERQNRVKASEIAKIGQVPFTDPVTGAVQPVSDKAGVPLTQYDRTNRIGWDSAGAPQEVSMDPYGNPEVKDPFAGLPTQTDLKTGDIYKVRKGLPWQWQGKDEKVAKENAALEQQKELSRLSTAIGGKLTQDTRAYHTAKKELNSLVTSVAGTIPEILNPDATREDVAKQVDQSFDQKKKEAEKTDGWFGFGGNPTQESLTAQQQIEADRQRSHKQLDQIYSLRDKIAEHRGSTENTAALAQQISTQRQQGEIERARAMGIPIPEDSNLLKAQETGAVSSTPELDASDEQDPALIPIPKTQAQQAREQQQVEQQQVEQQAQPGKFDQDIAILPANTQQAIAEAKDKKKDYSWDGEKGLTFIPEKMIEGLSQAINDGLLTREQAAPLFQPFLKVQRQKIELNSLAEQAGGWQEAKALIHGMGAAGAFLATAPIGAGIGAEAGAPAGPWGAGIGGTVGGLVTGTMGSMAYNALVKKLGEYNDTIGSISASSELHPMWNAAGELAGFAAGLPKLGMKAVGATIEGAADSAAASSSVAGKTADALRRTINNADQAAKAAQEAGTAIPTPITQDIAARASRYLDAIGKTYGKSGGGLAETIKNLSDQASVQTAQGVSEGATKGAAASAAAATIAKQAFISAGTMVAIDTAIKEGGKALGFSDQGQTWGGVGFASMIGLFAMGHGMEMKGYDQKAMGDVILRGASHDVTGTPLHEVVDVAALSKAKGVDLSKADINEVQQMTRPLTPEEQQIYDDFKSKATDLISQGKIKADLSDVQTSARQILKSGRTSGIRDVVVEPKGQEPPPNATNDATPGLPSGPALQPEPVEPEHLAQGGEKPAQAKEVTPGTPEPPAAEQPTAPQESTFTPSSQLTEAKTRLFRVQGPEAIRGIKGTPIEQLDAINAKLQDSHGKVQIPFAFGSLVDFGNQGQYTVKQVNDDFTYLEARDGTVTKVPTNQMQEGLNSGFYGIESDITKPNEAQVANASESAAPATELPVVTPEASAAEVVPEVAAKPVETSAAAVSPVEPSAEPPATVDEPALQGAATSLHKNPSTEGVEYRATAAPSAPVEAGAKPATELEQGVRGRLIESLNKAIPNSNRGMSEWVDGQGLVRAVVDSDPKPLILLNNGLNMASLNAVAQEAGFKLPGGKNPTQTSVGKAIRAWAGPEKYDAAMAEVNADKSKAQAESDEKSADFKYKVAQRAAADIIAKYPDGSTVPGDQAVLDLIKSGYNRLVSTKKGAVPQWHLINKAEQSTALSGEMLRFAKMHLERESTEQSNPSPTPEEKPTVKTPPLERAMEIEKEFGLDAADAHFFNVGIDAVKASPEKWTTLAEGLQKEAMRAAIAGKGSLAKTGDLSLAKRIAEKYLSPTGEESGKQELSNEKETPETSPEHGKGTPAKPDQGSKPTSEGLAEAGDGKKPPGEVSRARRTVEAEVQKKQRLLDNLGVKLEDGTKEGSGGVYATLDGDLLFNDQDHATAMDKIQSDGGDPYKWSAATVDEEGSHLKDIAATPKGKFEALHIAFWNSFPEPFRKAVEAMRPGLPKWKLGAESIRMLDQYDRLGYITEALIPKDREAAEALYPLFQAKQPAEVAAHLAEMNRFETETVAEVEASRTPAPQEKATSPEKPEANAPPKVSDAEAEAQKKAKDLFDSLDSKSPSVSKSPETIEQAVFPPDKIGTVIDLAQSILKAEHDNPEKMAAWLDETVGVKARKYSQALSGVMSAFNKAFSGEHDWTKIYSSIDTAGQQSDTKAGGQNENGSTKSELGGSTEAGNGEAAGGKSESDNTLTDGRVGGSKPGTSEGTGIEGGTSGSGEAGAGGGSDGGTGGDQGTRTDAPPEQLRDGGGLRGRKSNPVLTNFVITPSDDIGGGTLTEKFAANMAAIKLLKEIEAREEPATLQEKKVLVKYVGWGGMKNAFNPDKDDWRKRHEELKTLLTPEEYEEAQHTILDAHYTSPTIIGGIYQALEQFGFRGGKMVEGGSGIGHFPGFLPVGMRDNTSYIGVERDGLTARIAQILYPLFSMLNKAFEDADLTRNSFDASVGNPPFGNRQLFDKNFKEASRFTIHNFFIAKEIELLRPGGILAKVVSHFFLDAQDPAARKWINEQAEFLGAIRLPNNTFKKNANTEVTTDIVFFQKRGFGEKPVETSWVNVVDALIGKVGEQEPAKLNQWMKEHPEMMLGEPSMAGTMHAGKLEFTLNPRYDGSSLEEDLAKAIKTLPKNIYNPIERETKRLTAPESNVPDGVKVGSYFIGEDGNIQRRTKDSDEKRQSITPEFQNKTQPDRVRGMIGIRDAVTKLVKAESTDADLKVMKALRKHLNTLYDKYVAKHGPLNTFTNRRAFRDDTDCFRLLALEKDFDPGIGKEAAKKRGVPERKPKAEKAAIFKQRVNVGYHEVTSAEGAKDALTVSLNQRGTVDIPYMVQLSGMTAEDILKDLGDQIFQDPSGDWQQAEKYLSGNVREKLREAEEAAKGSSAFERNVEALKKAIPADIQPQDIRIPLGAGWVDPIYYKQFATHLVGEEPVTLAYASAMAKWNVDMPDESVNAQDTYGVPGSPVHAGMPFGSILSAIMNTKPPVVYKFRHRDDPQVVDEEATAAAAEKAEMIKEKWSDWVMQDQDRRDALSRKYNDTVNCFADTKPNGLHLTLPGKSALVNLYPHQLNGAWRIITDRTALLDQVVGAGKTFIVSTAVMEMKRLGFAQKQLIVVPNHLTTQWRDSIIQLYPNANVLYATAKDFEKKNRQALFARMMTGEYDAMIMGHSSLIKIGMPKEAEVDLLNEMLREIVDSIRAMRQEEREGAGKSKKSDSRFLAGMERTKESVEAKLKEAQNRTAGADASITFDELGIDGLYVDEAHEFKNLFYTSSMQRVAGLGNPKGSAKAFDLFVKTRWMRQRYGGKAPLVFATGTPVSNSLVEMFTMQRYLQGDRLKAMGINTLDAWARVFGDVKSVYEVDPSGTRYRLSMRFANFMNVGELSAMYRSVADVVTLNDLKQQAIDRGTVFPVPRVKGGKPNNIVVERSEDQARYFGLEIPQLNADGSELLDEDENPVVKYTPGSLLDRIENLDPSTKELDNMLKITNDARKSSLDMRLINPNLPDFPGSKPNKAVTEIKRIYDAWNARKGTQLVFCDLSVPSSARGKATKKAKELAGETYIASDGHGEYTIIPDARPVQLSAAPDKEFFIYKERKFYRVVEKSTGLRVGMGSTKETAIDAAEHSDTLHPGNAERLKKAIEEQAIPLEEVVRLRDDYERKNGFKNQTDDTVDSSDELKEEESGDGVSMDELLADSSTHSVYDDMRDKLVASGVPMKHIAFIHDYDTPEKKMKLFTEMNNGDVRILFGSTAKLGAGTNVQRRLVAVTHLDAPWRPSDLEQREGRIIRQGNLFYEEGMAKYSDPKEYDTDPDAFEVEILRFATQQTYDTRMWQLIEHKAAGIGQFRTADRTVRDLEDVAGEAANASDMKAAASGDPAIQHEIELRGKVKKLTLLQKAWQSNHYQREANVKWLKGAPERYKAARVRWDEWNKFAEEHPKPEEFEASIRQETGEHVKTTDKEAFMQAFIDAVKSMSGERDSVGKVFGEYRGVTLRATKGYNNTEIRGSARGVSSTDLTTFYGSDMVTPGGLVQRLDNAISDGPNQQIAHLDRGLAEDQRKLPEEEALAANKFERQGELDAARAEHAEALTTLRSKRRPIKTEAVPIVATENPVSDDLLESHSDLENEGGKHHPRIDAAGNQLFSKAPIRFKNATLTRPGLVTLDSKSPITAHHGTPHKVDRFSLDKIGIGEGAQTYGWGLYFADQPDTARSYQEGVSLMRQQRVSKVFLDGYDISNWLEGDMALRHGITRRQAAAVAQLARDGITKNVKIDGRNPSIKEIADRIEIKPTGVSENKGNLYTVHLDVEPDEFLDWDKPISEQGEKVRSALKNDPISFSTLEWLKQYESDGRPASFNGANFYSHLSDKVGEEKNTGQADFMGGMSSPKDASDHLLSLGIFGIRFLDQGSRQNPETVRYDTGLKKWLVEKSDGGISSDVISSHDTEAEARAVAKVASYNYVMFDDSKIRIVAENGKPVTGQERENIINPETLDSKSPIQNREVEKGDTVRDRMTKKTGTVISVGKSMAVVKLDETGFKYPFPIHGLEVVSNGDKALYSKAPDTLTETIAQNMPGYNGIKSLLLPSAISPEHLRAAEDVGWAIGDSNHNQEITNKLFKKDWLMFEKLGVQKESMPIDKNPGIKFASDSSMGRPMSQDMQKIASKADSEFQKRIALLEKYGAPMSTVMENYFPGIWTRESREAFNLAVESAIHAGILSEGSNLNDATTDQKEWVKDLVDRYLKDKKGSTKDALSMLSKTPFKGKESFRKPKVFDRDILIAFEFGLRPASYNPVDLIKLKLAEMDRSIMANQVLAKWKKEGKVRVRRLSEKTPEGWEDVQDKYGPVYGPREIKVTSRNSKLYDEDGMRIEPSDIGLDDLPPEGTTLMVKVPGVMIMGHRMIPKPNADILNNYLSSSLYNNRYFGELYTGWMAVANALNQAQLGVGSAFHIGFTTIEATVSGIANLTKDIYGVMRGNRTFKQLFKSVGMAVISPVETGSTGDKILNAYRDPNGTIDPRIAKVIRAVELAGGGFKMEKGLKTDQISKLQSDWFNDHKMRAAARSPFAFVETLALPIMDYIVPRQKAGVFSHMAWRIIEQNPDKSMEDLAPEFRSAWNRVDARLGQVRYDRLFAHNTAKNLIQGMVRAPGWTGGTISELGGAFKDTYDFFREWAGTIPPKGPGGRGPGGGGGPEGPGENIPAPGFGKGKMPQDIPDRVAYTISLLLLTFIANGVITYVLTGKRPEDMDYWAFRTGRKDAAGRNERMMLPTYAKDLLAYAEAPLTTLLHKSHPLLSVIGDLTRNKDYYGVQISDPDANAIKRLYQNGKYFAKAFEPFWIRGMRKNLESEKGLSATALPWIGVMPAPSSITKTPAEKKIAEINQARMPSLPITEQQQERRVAKSHLINEVRQGKTSGISKAVREKTIRLEDVKLIMKKAKMTPLQASVNTMTTSQLQQIIEIANPSEKRQLLPILSRKLQSSRSASTMFTGF